VVGAVHEVYEAKVTRVGAPIMRHVEKEIMLRKLDQHWREHLGAMDYLRQGIHLRGYAQKDYRFEFKREAFEMFAAMLERIKYETVSLVATIEVRTQEQIEREEEERHHRLMRALQAQHAEAASALTGSAGAEEPVPGAAAPALPERRGAVAGASSAAAASLPPPELSGTFVRSERKVGRNEPCPCGSGKKYKLCHGALSSVE
jgi:preprotein translocase subunit SecA